MPPLPSNTLTTKHVSERPIGSSSPFIKKDAHKSYNSIIPGRNFINDIIDLDSMARIFANLHRAINEDIAKLAVLAILDFAVAFPSVAHTWIFTVLHTMGLPQGFIYYIAALSFMNVANFKVDGDFKPFFTICS